MSPLAQRIAHAVAVALVLIVRAGLRLVPRVCSRCQHSGEALVAQKLA